MNDDYVARKERWARKQAGNSIPTNRSTDRLPPGQRLVSNFPVLDLGLRPEVTQETWQLKIDGLVEKPPTMNWAAFMALPQFEDRSDFHCVTTWSQFDMLWSGVAFFTIADLVKPTTEAKYVSFSKPSGGLPG